MRSWLPLACCRVSALTIWMGERLDATCTPGWRVPVTTTSCSPERDRVAGSCVHPVSARDADPQTANNSAIRPRSPRFCEFASRSCEPPGAGFLCEPASALLAPGRWDTEADFER